MLKTCETLHFLDLDFGFQTLGPGFRKEISRKNPTLKSKCLILQLQRRRFKKNEADTICKCDLSTALYGSKATAGERNAAD